MFKFNALAYSQLYDNETFDRQFLRDVRRCRESLVIESPFIRLNRVHDLMPTLTRLRSKGVRVVINTRPPDEHDDSYRRQANEAILSLQSIGVRVLFTVRHHRKLAIIDREVFWEGSLNILSYYDSCEIMRRTVSSAEAETLINFIGINKYLRKVN
jgi:phosphatidylserine/phosphatidylglycerophosphate/cardiolipin synthase-like enzyme